MQNYGPFGVAPVKGCSFSVVLKRCVRGEASVCMKGSCPAGEKFAHSGGMDGIGCTPHGK